MLNACLSISALFSASRVGPRSARRSAPRRGKHADANKVRMSMKSTISKRTPCTLTAENAARTYNPRLKGTDPPQRVPYVCGCLKCACVSPMAHGMRYPGPTPPHGTTPLEPHKDTQRTHVHSDKAMHDPTGHLCMRTLMMCMYDPLRTRTEQNRTKTPNRERGPNRAPVTDPLRTMA